MMAALLALENHVDKPPPLLDSDDDKLIPPPMVKKSTTSKKKSNDCLSKNMSRILKKPLFMGGNL